MVIISHALPNILWLARCYFGKSGALYDTNLTEISSRLNLLVLNEETLLKPGGQTVLTCMGTNRIELFAFGC